MAQKIQILLIDDIDGGEADETVTFALDGKTYEIDLSADNAHVLRARLKQFIQAGRLIRGGGAFNPRSKHPRPVSTGDGAQPSSHQGGEDPAEIRAWAGKHGVILPVRGRLPKRVKQAFTAHKLNDPKPLEALLKEQGGRADAPIPHQDEEDPAAPQETAAAVQDTILSLPQPATTPQEVKPTEEEAARHYRPLDVPTGRDGKSWRNRTAHGCDRTDKVAEMTLLERVEILTDRQVRMLGQLSGAVPLDKGNKVSYLATSAARLVNLEVIDHHHQITDFGRYAYTVRSQEGTAAAA